MPKHQLCRNCGHTVDSNYCPVCGQRTSTRRLGWASLAESVTSTFIGDEAYGLRGIDMRKGAATTWLSILFRPHRVIPEFIAGRRRKYFNPVAILLLLSTFYAVVFLLVGKEYTPLASDGQPMFRWLVSTYIDYATLHPAGYLLLMLPFFALAMKTVFRRKADLRYVEYLYVGIFLAIFEITLMIAALPAELLLPWYSSFYMMTLPLFLYTAFVFRNIFGLKKKRSALLRTLLTDLLQYVYMFLITLTIASCTVGCYYFIAPEQFKKEFSFDRKASAGQPDAAETTAFQDIIDGIVDVFNEEDEADGTETARQPADSLPAK